jgi:hypothetical protein
MQLTNLIGASMTPEHVLGLRITASEIGPILSAIAHPEGQAPRLGLAGALTPAADIPLIADPLAA